VLGAGVCRPAGHQPQPNAMARWFSAYDVRSAVKEQDREPRARFVVLEIESGGRGQGGYAKAMDEALLQASTRIAAAVLKEQDVVITTAACPGRKAPILITTEMAEQMRPFP